MRNYQHTENSPASIQQNITLNPENFYSLRNFHNSNISQPLSIPKTKNLDIIITKLKEIETISSNIMNLASNPVIPLDFLKGLLNVKFLSSLPMFQL